MAEPICFDCQVPVGNKDWMQACIVGETVPFCNSFCYFTYCKKADEDLSIVEAGLRRLPEPITVIPLSEIEPLTRYCAGKCGRKWPLAKSDEGRCDGSIYLCPDCLFKRFPKWTSNQERLHSFEYFRIKEIPVDWSKHAQANKPA